MSFSRDQFDRAVAFREVYGGKAGPAVLLDELKACGLFSDPVEATHLLVAKPQLVPLFLSGLVRLANLGIWQSENWSSLIDKLLEVPIPNVKEEGTEEEDGETL